MKGIKNYSLLALTLFLVLATSHCHGNPKKIVRAEKKPVYEISFNLGGIILNIRTPFFPNQVSYIAESQDPVQVANFLERQPVFQSMSLTAIPFSSKIGSEIFPAARAGTATVFRNMLRAYREGEGRYVQDGPNATLFGTEIPSTLSISNVYIDVQNQSPIYIVEWIFEGGNRLWILRFTQEIEIIDDDPSPNAIEAKRKAWNGVVLSSPNLEDLSIDSDEIEYPIGIIDVLDQSNQSELPYPYWWDGDCDTNTYYDQTGIHAYPLGGSFRNMKACGPRPWFDSGPHALVHFYPGSWGVLEWECVELSMRFLQIAYGIAPYQANGNQVVPHYQGDRLIKVNNGTPGYSPLPNDVLSSGPETTYGHTAVVIASDVDESGNGSITILEQNSSPTGLRSFNVVNWEVIGNYTVIGWLHDPTDELERYFFPIIH